MRRHWLGNHQDGKTEDWFASNSLLVVIQERELQVCSDWCFVLYHLCTYDVLYILSFILSSQVQVRMFPRGFRMVNNQNTSHSASNTQPVPVNKNMKSIQKLNR